MNAEELNDIYEDIIVNKKQPTRQQDAIIWCYLNHKEFKKIDEETDELVYWNNNMRMFDFRVPMEDVPQYFTNMLDAKKLIDPSWSPRIIPAHTSHSVHYTVILEVPPISKARGFREYAEGDVIDLPRVVAGLACRAHAESFISSRNLPKTVRLYA